MRAGEGQAALASFATAITLLDDSPESRARAHLNRGWVHLQRGDTERAVEDSRRAAELFRQAGNEIEAAKADHNVGYARLLAGDLVGALRAMEAAAPVLEDLSATFRAVVAQDRAEVLVAAGMPADAQEAFEQAARAYGSRRLRQRQGEVELILARSLAWDDPRRAASVARRAERRFRQRGSEAWALRAEAVKVAAEIEARLPVSSADGARRRAGRHPARPRAPERGADDDGACRAVRARDRRRAGRRCAARDRAAGATTPLAVRLLTREVRADVAAAKGRRSTALDHVRRGLDELHEWQSTFGSLDLQSSLVGHGRRLAFAGLRLALEDGRPEVVFEWSERARALATRVAAVRPPSDPDAAQALTALRQSSDEATAAPLRARIRQQAWYGEGSGQVATPAGLDEVAAELAGSGAVLTSYLVVDDTVHCLVVGDGRREVVRLGSFAPVRTLLSGMQADLDMAASNLPAALRDVVVEGLLARVRGLGGAARGAARRRASPPVGWSSCRRRRWPGRRGRCCPGSSDRTLTVPRSATLWVDGRRRPLLARTGSASSPGPERGAAPTRRCGEAAAAMDRRPRAC